MANSSVAVALSEHDYGVAGSPERGVGSRLAVVPDLDPSRAERSTWGGFRWSPGRFGRLGTKEGLVGARLSAATFYVRAPGRRPLLLVRRPPLQRYAGHLPDRWQPGSAPVEHAAARTARMAGTAASRRSAAGDIPCSWQRTLRRQEAAKLGAGPPGRNRAYAPALGSPVACASGFPAGDSRPPRPAAGCPRQESNLRARFRKPLLSPLSYGGAATSVGQAWASPIKARRGARPPCPRLRPGGAARPLGRDRPRR